MCLDSEEQPQIYFPPTNLTISFSNFQSHGVTDIGNGKMKFSDSEEVGSPNLVTQISLSLATCSQNFNTYVPSSQEINEKVIE